MSVAKIEFPETMDETRQRPRVGGLNDPRLGTIDRNFKCQTVSIVANMEKGGNGSSRLTATRSAVFSFGQLWIGGFPGQTDHTSPDRLTTTGEKVVRSVMLCKVSLPLLARPVMRDRQYQICVITPVFPHPSLQVVYTTCDSRSSTNPVWRRHGRMPRPFRPYRARQARVPHWIHCQNQKNL